MNEPLTLTEQIEQEKEKVKDMDKKTKWSYFKTYYLSKVLIGLAVLCMVVWFGYDMIQGSREIVMSGCMINVNINSEGHQFLTNDYVTASGNDPKKVIAQVSLENNLMFMDEEQAMDNQSYEMALFAQIAAGDYDYMILDEAAFEHFQKADIYSDLSQVLSSQELEVWQDRLVYTKRPDGKEDTFASAIRLTDTVLCERFEFNSKEVYIVLINVNEQNGNGKRLLDYIRLAI